MKALTCLGKDPLLQDLFNLVSQHWAVREGKDGNDSYEPEGEDGYEDGEAGTEANVPGDGGAEGGADPAVEEDQPVPVDAKDATPPPLDHTIEVALGLGIVNAPEPAHTSPESQLLSWDDEIPATQPDPPVHDGYGTPKVECPKPPSQMVKKPKVLIIEDSPENTSEPTCKKRKGEDELDEMDAKIARLKSSLDLNCSIYGFR